MYKTAVTPVREVANTLKQTYLFRSLDGKSLRFLAAQAVEFHYKPNSILFMAGETAPGLFVLASGAVRGVRASTNGREQVVFVERAPATVAEVPVFDDGVFTLTAIAEESTKVYFFDKALLHTLCLENPSFAMTALKVIGQRVRTLTELVEELSLCEVDMRLAHFLLSEAQRRGERVNGHIHLDLNLTRSQIATRIGTVREVVSRKLVQMQSEGLIELEKRHLTIKDPERFQQYAKAGKK